MAYSRSRNSEKITGNQTLLTDGLNQNGLINVPHVVSDIMLSSMFFQWLRDAVFSRFHSTSFTEALKTMSLSGEDYLFAKGAWLELVKGFNHQIFAIWDEQIQVSWWTAYQLQPPSAIWT